MMINGIILIMACHQLPQLDGLSRFIHVHGFGGPIRKTEVRRHHQCQKHQEEGAG